MQRNIFVVYFSSDLTIIYKINKLTYWKIET